MTEHERPNPVNQQELWDTMHGRQSADGSLVGRSLTTRPNQLAVILGEKLSADQHVLEVGSANGRDARYWAKHKGILVHALDFSQVALDQLQNLAEEEGVDNLITTGLFDANTDPLPALPNSQDAFYARSALHVTDTRLSQLFKAVHVALRSNGLVAIEGKHPDDPKIKRSVPLDPDSQFLVSDPFDDDHVRRVWDPQYTHNALEVAGFEVTQLDVIHDVTDYADPSIFTRVLAVKP